MAQSILETLEEKMDNNLRRQPETMINLGEVLWDLTEQWKAVLLTAFAMMFLITGIKYAKDNKAFDVAQAEKMEQESTASVEERVSAVLEALPKDERATVMAIVNQNELIETEKEYIRDSVLMNTDPTSQRTLCVYYFIKSEDSEKDVEPAIIKGYMAYLNSEDVIKSIGDAIDPKIGRNYISELIYTKVAGSSNSSDEVKDKILEVYIVLPEKAEYDKVEKALTSTLFSFSSELTKNIGPHRISLIYSGERFVYNEKAANTRTNTLYSINNLQNNTKNMLTSLSDAQKAAIDSIATIKKESDKSQTDEQTEQTEKESATEEYELKKPGISKKYALLGFALGIMMYAFIYFILIILKGQVRSSSDAEYYSQTRLFGDIYSVKEHKGFRKLLYSRIVNRFRYRDKLDEDKQLNKAVASIDTACKYSEIDSISAISFSELSEAGNKILEVIKEKGIKVNHTDITKEIDDSYLLKQKNVIFITEEGNKISDISNTIEKMNEYGINRIGSIFMKSI